VDGRLAAEVIDNDPSQRDLAGILALQLHTGPPTTAQFKDIRLKVLKPGAAVQAAPTIPAWRWLRVATPDEDINEGARLAVKAIWEGAAPKAGVLVPTVCGTGSAYPYWIHP